MTSFITSAPDELERLQARVQVLEQERRHVLAVIEILQDIAGSLQFADIVQAVARHLGETFGLDRCSVFLAERNGAVRLVASYEDPSIRNYVVDLERYPELKKALATGETVFVPDVSTDPMFATARDALLVRKARSITVVPITWRRAAIGAIFLRTFRDGPAFSESDVQFCRVVASLTAKALRNAHRYERLQQRVHGGRTSDDAERAALLEFIRRLLGAAAARGTLWAAGEAPRATTAELDRLVDVALTVLSQEPGGA